MARAIGSTADGVLARPADLATRRPLRPWRSTPPSRPGGCRRMAVGLGA
jgi:hypothetical protein